MKPRRGQAKADDNIFRKPMMVQNEYRDSFIHSLRWPAITYDSSGLIKTPTFSLCGSDWQLCIYPFGVDNSGEYLSLHLVSLSSEMVRCNYGFALKNRSGGDDFEWFDPEETVTFSSAELGNNEWGCDEYIPLADLEDSDYVKDKQLQIEVIITVYGREDLNSSDSMAEAIEKAGAPEELIKVANEDLHEVISRLPVRRNMKAQKKQEDHIVVQRGLKK